MRVYLNTVELYLQPELETSTALNIRPLMVLSSLSVFVLFGNVLLAESLLRAELYQTTEPVCTFLEEYSLYLKGFSRKKKENTLHK